MRKIDKSKALPPELAAREGIILENGRRIYTTGYLRRIREAYRDILKETSVDQKMTSSDQMEE